MGLQGGIERGIRHERGKVTDPQYRSNKPMVLILEDDSCSALALAVLLEELGCVVHICANGELARTFIPLQIPDLLIADWSVEGALSSVELARQMRRVDPSLPVFFVSGHHSADIQECLSDLGECTIFEKPLNYEEFLAQVRTRLFPPVVLTGQGVERRSVV